VRVSVDVALELVDSTSQRTEPWVAGTELLDPPFHFTEPVEGLFWFPMPETPLHAFKSRPHLSSDGWVETHHSDQKLAPVVAPAWQDETNPTGARRAG
jgi:hypothetical protein